METKFCNYPNSEEKQNYFRLIRKAQNRKSIEGLSIEQHHILPRSLGGTNEPENLVKLTLYEHLLAHYYLAKFTDTDEMQYALAQMSSGQFKKLKDPERASLEEIQDWERVVEQAKRRAIYHSQSTLRARYGSCTGCMNTDEARKKAQEARKQHYGTSLGRLKDPDVVERRNRTIVERYGNLCGMMHSEEAVRKSQETQTLKYGHPAGQMNTPEALKKSQNSRKILGNGDCMWACHSEESKEKQRKSRELQSTVFHSKVFQEWFQTKSYRNHQWMRAVKDFLTQTGKSLQDFKEKQ